MLYVAKEEFVVLDPGDEQPEHCDMKVYEGDFEIHVDGVKVEQADLTGPLYPIYPYHWLAYSWYGY